MTGTSFDFITLERLDGHVLKVTVDRPDSDLNAINEQLHGELTRVMQVLKHEREARCIVLTGAGKAFSAGGDYDWFPKLQEPGQFEALRQEGKNLIWVHPSPCSATSSSWPSQRSLETRMSMSASLPVMVARSRGHSPLAQLWPSNTCSLVTPSTPPRPIASDSSTSWRPTTSA